MDYKPISQTTDEQLQDWYAAEREYLAQRPIDGSVPRKQLWHEDTIEARAYEIYKSRIAAHAKAK